MVDGDEQPGATRGNIGNEIFEQVEKIISEEGLTRTQAFQRLSERTGRRAGTVAANYYRVARQRGAALQPRAPRGSKSRGGAAGRGASAAAEAALSKAREALEELSAVVRAQDREIADAAGRRGQVGEGARPHRVSAGSLGCQRGITGCLTPGEAARAAATSSSAIGGCRNSSTGISPAAIIASARANASGV